MSSTSSSPGPGSSTDDGASSVSAMVSTLVPVLLLAIVYVAVFLVLRRSHTRYYAPRTYLGSIREAERTPPLSNSLLGWFKQFSAIPDEFALEHQSLDSYLFLRFLKICCTIMFVGCCLTWPILFPLNATGHANQQGLNILSFSNLNKDYTSDKYRMIGNALIGWVFFGFVLFMVARETIFYINLRQAYLLSPMYANRISARTVLFTSVPITYLSEHKIREVFGKSVKHVWVIRDTEELDELVKNRDKLAYKLEGAEVKLIKQANAARLKSMKKASLPDEEAHAPITASATDATIHGESGSIAARWLPAKKRPTHKLGLFGLFGKKVDTINYARDELPELISKTAAAQQAYIAGDVKAISAIFVEFYTQAEAQTAFQVLSHHQALQMSHRYIGVQPFEIVWKSLKMSWWQRVIRRYLVLGFIAALIVLWAIPVAVVGFISNIQNIIELLPWLGFINNIPDVILGVVTGLLPSVLLAVLMSLVPIIMRLCAKLSGEPTTARVELFTQNAYFCFQVIQVFLVVAVGSSATAAISQIIDDPSSAPNLLAQSIPKSANFYIAYFLLQGFAIAGGVLTQVVGFIIFNLLYKFLASTPRSMYQKWTSLSSISWGSLLPVYCNMVVIGLVYSCIAPLIMGFATIGLFLYYIAYRYNVLFVTDNKIDTQGLIYPRALQQLLTGVYLGLIVMIGLFALAVSIPALVLTVIFLIVFALVHLSINKAFEPLLASLPKTLEAEEENNVSQVEYGITGKRSGGTSMEKTARPIASGKDGKKPSILSRFLRPDRYSNYRELRRRVPHNLVNPQYSEEIEREAYYPPSVKAATPLLWIARDEVGMSAQEIAHTSKVIDITDEAATLDGKNKIQWDRESARPPIWEEKIYY